MKHVRVDHLFNAKPSKWDSHAIKAEIRRRGQTLEGIARMEGVDGAQMRGCFRLPTVRANGAISRFLNVPLHELWPAFFDMDGDLIPARYRKKLSRLRSGNASHESRVA